MRALRSAAKAPPRFALAPARQRSTLLPDVASCLLFLLLALAGNRGLGPVPAPHARIDAGSPRLEVAMTSGYKRYSTPTGGTLLGAITYGMMGELWFTEINSGKVAAISESGEVHEYTIPLPETIPEDIVLGPDGRMWFTEQGTGVLGAISWNGVITDYPVQTDSAGIIGLALGRDNRLWFTMQDTDEIGAMSRWGAVIEYHVPIPDAAPHDIALGPDGRILVHRARSRSYRGNYDKRRSHGIRSADGELGGPQHCLGT